MTDIEQVILKILKPHGFKTIKDRPQIIEGVSFSNINQHVHNNNKIVNITGTQIKLHQRNSTWDTWTTISADLCDPNSLQIIEDWAKT